MMNFDRHGLDEFPLGSDYVEAFFRLENPEEMNMFGYQHCVGSYVINGRAYSISLTKETGSDMIGFVSVGLRYGDDTFEGTDIEKLQPIEFTKALSRTGSLARLISNTIFWPEELMTFYTSEGAVQTIAWNTKSEYSEHLETATRDL